MTRPAVANPGWSHRPQVPVECLVAAGATARRIRAEWLAALGAGMVSVSELLDAAAADPASPLRRIRLVEMYATQPGWGRGRATTALTTLRRAAKVSPRVPDGALTVGWALDRRAGARRRCAALEPTAPRISPGPRFPFGPPHPEQHPRARVGQRLSGG